MAELDPRGLEILSDAECLTLLRPGGVCRLAWVVDGRAVIRPLNFALHEGQRLIASTNEGKIHAAARSALQVAFETDSYRNLDHTGWSVIVNGPIGLIDETEVSDVPLRSWAPKGSNQFIQVTIDEMSGRRIGGKV